MIMSRKGYFEPIQTFDYTNITNYIVKYHKNLIKIGVFLKCKLHYAYNII